MRRLAAAFSKKDKSSRQDSPPSSSSLRLPKLSIRNLASASSERLSPPSLTRSAATHSTCSSNFSSPSLPATPNDDDVLHRPQGRVGAWLARRKTKSRVKLISDNDGSDANQPPPPSLPNQSKSARSPPRIKNSNALDLPPPARPLSVDSDSDSSSESDPGIAALSSTVLARPVHPSILQSAQKAFRDFTTASLMPRPTPSPLLHIPQSTINTFPRSMKPWTAGPHIQSQELVAIVHKKKMLKRSHFEELSASEQSSVAAFVRLSKAIPQTPPNIPEASPHANQLRPFSSGLRKWIDRPCYEDRSEMWILDEQGELVSRVIPGTSAAVADLEFSQRIEALAGVVMPNMVDSLPVIPRLMPAQSSQMQLKREPVLPTMESLSPKSTPENIDGPQRPSPASSASPSRNVISSSRSKRGVRFHVEVDEVDSDDLVPLALTLQINRQAAERKRLLEEEEDRKVRDAQAKAREEVRRKKQYAEEVISSRRRREAQRNGYKPRPGLPNEDSPSPTDHGPTASRPKYDKRHSSSSAQSLRELEACDTRSRSRGSSPSYSRPTSYASSGDESLPFSGSRASSSSSVAGLGTFTYSPATSTDDLRAGRRRSVASSDDAIVMRSRKISDRGRRTTLLSTETTPPVPFLARNWDVQDVPIPHEQLMQQGPFMASVRSQRRTPLRTSHSSDQVEVRTQSPEPHLGRQRHLSERDIPLNRISQTFAPSNFSHVNVSPHPRAFEPGRRGTVIF